MATGESFGQPIPGYEVQAQIGTGGTGTVYRAQQLSLGREVALKVLRGDREERATKLKRMEKEAHILARLDHPNIVRSIDFGEVEELVYFVLEYVPGVSAKQLLEKRGKLPVRDSIVLTEKVAKALGFAARHGVVHRDVKPGNILLAKDGSVKLSDFGLARAVFDRSLTRDGATLGTPQYMSPEQVRHARGVDLRSDLYSLGATLYHLVTGQAPYHGESVAEILHEVLYGRPTPPEQLNPEIPPALSRVIARLMARDPGRRYQDVDSLLRDLQRVRRLLDPDAEADPDPIGLSWQAAAEAPRVWRNRWPLIGGGVALVALGASLAFVLAGGDGPPAEGADPMVEELAALEELRGRLETGSPFAVLRILDDLADRGGSAGEAEVARAALEQDAREAAREFLRRAAEEARAAGREELRRGELRAAERSVEAAFARRLERAGESASAAPDDLCGFDVRRVSEEVLRAARAEQSAVRETVRAAMTDLHLGLRRELLDEVRGSVRSPGLLQEHRYAEARERLEAHRQAIRPAEQEALADAYARAGVELEPGLDAAALRDRLPAEFVEEVATATQRAIEELEMATLEASTDLQRELHGLVVQAQTTLEGLDFDDPRVLDEPAVWRERLIARFPLAPREDLPSEPPHDWRAALAEHEAAVERRLQELRTERRAHRAQSVLYGEEEGAGLIDRLQAYDLVGAQGLLTEADELPEDFRADWQRVVDRAEGLIDATWKRLERRDGETLELRSRAGIRLEDTLRFGGRDRAFRIGPTRLEFADLPLSFLLESEPEPLEPPDLALLQILWGGKAEREAAESAAESLATDDAVSASVRERLERDRMIADGRREELEDQAEALWSAIEEALSAQRYEDARSALDEFGRPRYRRTEAYLAHRDRLRQLRKDVQEGLRLQASSRGLQPRYAHAAEFELGRDGRVRLRYDFTEAEQGEDFRLVGGVEVSNRALRFLNSQSVGLVELGLRGPRLPLSIDRSQPFRLELVIRIPHEEDVPKFVGVGVDGLCVGFYQPTLRAETLAGQLNGWEGRLDDYKDHFFDPHFGFSEPRRGRRPAEIGLNVARHSLRVDWDPQRDDALELSVDGQLVLVVKASPRGEGTGQLELRVAAPASAQSRGEGTERFLLQSLHFEGVLEQ